MHTIALATARRDRIRTKTPSEPSLLPIFIQACFEQNRGGASEGLGRIDPSLFAGIDLRKVQQANRGPQGAGTLLRLVRRGVTGPSRDKHEFGWSHYLGRLKTVSGGSNPGPDPFADPNIRHG